MTSRLVFSNSDSNARVLSCPHPNSAMCDVYYLVPKQTSKYEPLKVCVNICVADFFSFLSRRRWEGNEGNGTKCEKLRLRRRQ